jgi:saccharopine dehydrogenase-like NADP-dependent oxidoreductase
VRIEVPGAGRYDGYANRDSLSYRKAYGLDDIPTLLRGTLRNEGFCSAWQVFVNLGLTDDTFKVEHSETMTYRQLVEAFIPPATFGTELEERLARFCGIDPEGPSMDRIRSTGILEDKAIGIENASPAQILQHLLEQRWKLQPGDIDLIVMQHVFDYTLDGKTHQLRSSLVVKGENEQFTAMAKTVGLPLGIAAVRLLKGEFSMHTGVHIPVHRDFYRPILEELAQQGIRFTEDEN